MSKKGAASEAAAIKPLVALPSLPRCDDGNRQKWITEYDRVEAELLKPHLALPGAPTMTLGLRSLPSSWSGGNGPADGEAADNAAGPPLKRLPPRSQSTDPSGASGLKGGRHSASIMSVSHASRSTSIMKGAAPGSSPRRPLSASSNGTSRNITASFQRSTSPAPTSVHQTLRTLFTLLDPPVDFRTSFTIDTTGIDLKWLRQYVSGDRTPTLLTLETIREDMLLMSSSNNSSKTSAAQPSSSAAQAKGNSSSAQMAHHHSHSTIDEVAINSPRSAIVLLRNGVTVRDLQMNPPVKTSLALTGHSDPKADEVAQISHRHAEDRRKNLLASLRQEYRDLCSNLSLFSILDEITTWKSMQQQPALMLTAGSDTPPAADTPRIGGSPLKRAKAESSSRRDLHQQRLERAAQFARELEKKAQEAEMRQLAKEQELQNHRTKRRDETVARSQQALKRLAELKEAMKHASEEELAALRERQRKAEEREAQREEQRQITIAEHKQMLEQKSQARQAKLIHAKAQVQEMLAQQAAAAAERERIAEERREAMMQEKAERRARVEAEQRHAAELREAARLKALQHEETERRLAEERTLHADDQLKAFAELKAKQRQELAILEAERNEKRHKAFEEAQKSDMQKREAAARKREAVENEISRLKERRRHDQLLEASYRHMLEDDKRFLVDRQARAQEFAKLVAVGAINEKARRAEAVSMQRKRGSSPTH